MFLTSWIYYCIFIRCSKNVYYTTFTEHVRYRPLYTTTARRYAIENISINNRREQVEKKKEARNNRNLKRTHYMKQIVGPYQEICFFTSDIYTRKEIRQDKWLANKSAWHRVPSLQSANGDIVPHTLSRLYRVLEVCGCFYPFSNGECVCVFVCVCRGGALWKIVDFSVPRPEIGWKSLMYGLDNSIRCLA